MKFSFRQILASAAGAVIAALIASSFGVTGTIVGVAIGSMAATLGTALVAQSIERGHKAVKQVAVRMPESTTSTLLRRMGGTGAAGGATSSVDAAPSEPEPTEVVGTVGEETESGPAGATVDPDATERVQMRPAGVEDAPVTERFEAKTVPLLPTDVLEGAGVVGVTGGAGVARAAGADGGVGGRRFTWKAFAGTAAIVFVLALGFVTAIELIANRPNIIRPSSPAESTTTSTPSTSTSTSTSSPTSSTTTSTTAASSTTTSTTAPATTTSNPTSATTTTTTAGP